MPLKTLKNLRLIRIKWNTLEVKSAMSITMLVQWGRSLGKRFQDFHHFWITNNEREIFPHIYSQCGRYRGASAKDMKAKWLFHMKFYIAHNIDSIIMVEFSKIISNCNYVTPQRNDLLAIVYFSHRPLEIFVKSFYLGVLHIAHSTVSPSTHILWPHFLFCGEFLYGTHLDAWSPFMGAQQLHPAINNTVDSSLLQTQWHTNCHRG